MENKIKKIAKEFEFLKNTGDIHSVLLYGSHAKGKQTPRSDVDICIVAPKNKNVSDYSLLLRKIWRKINSSRYDVRIFEELPLYIKMSVINNHKIIFSKNPQELDLYFYFFRKLWEGQAVNRMIN